MLPHPTCSVTVERGDHPRPELAGEEIVVTGVVTQRFDVEVRGRGRVAGLRFRPGGLAALTGQPASRWTDRTVGAAESVAPDVLEALRGLDLESGAEAIESGMARVEAAFPESVPEDGRYARVLRVVTDMLEERSILAVSELEDRHGVSARTLQRDFLHAATRLVRPGALHPRLHRPGGGVAEPLPTSGLSGFRGTWTLG